MNPGRSTVQDKTGSDRTGLRREEEQEERAVVVVIIIIATKQE